MLAVAPLLIAAGIVGHAAPAWPELRWVQGGPLSLQDLRGQVVLVRFFTDPGCPFCAATAPALNELDREFRDRGLVVIGFYTPKPRPHPVEVEDVRRAVASYGFRFPVAVDDEWKALRKLWLDRSPGAGWTSASLLIDRDGVVRHVHAGGAFARDSRDREARRGYEEMRSAIEALLAEKETRR